MIDSSKKSLDMAAMTTASKQSQRDSKFHWLFPPGQRSKTELFDKVVEETDNFVVLPTKGSLVPGWVLIIPKFPIPRIADVPLHLRGELDHLVARVSKSLRLNFGKIFSFEHGGFKGSQISCGIDQAHLHVTALDFDLFAKTQSASKGQWIDIEPKFVPGIDITDNEYWFVSSGERSICKEVDQPISQFFRKIIAKEIGKPEFWDYRSEDFIENVAMTIKAMR